MAVINGLPFVTQRSRRALETMTNVVPTTMLAIRKDTPKRVAQYMKRGFQVAYIPDKRSAPAQLYQLQKKVFENYDAERDLLDIRVLSEHYFSAIDTDQVASCLVQQNTAYSCHNIPRMVGLTCAVIKRFLAALSDLVDRIMSHCFARDLCILFGMLIS